MSDRHRHLGANLSTCAAAESCRRRIFHDGRRWQHRPGDEPEDGHEATNWQPGTEPAGR